MKKRKGLGKGLGKGYKNIVPRDPFIHGLSAKGVKTFNVPMKSSLSVIAKNKKEAIDKTIEYVDTTKISAVIIDKKVKKLDNYTAKGMERIGLVLDAKGELKVGDKISTSDFKEGIITAIKPYGYEVRIFDGNRIVGEKVVFPHDKPKRLDAKGKTWNKIGNISMYVGQHTSYWTMESGKNIYGKTKSGKKVKQPVDYVIVIYGEKGSPTESGSYTVSWFKGFTSEPSPLFAITPAFDMQIVGKEHQLKNKFWGRLSDVNRVRKVIADMITKTGKLPTEKEVTKKIVSMEKQFDDYDEYTVSNWIYEEKGGGR